MNNTETIKIKNQKIIEEIDPTLKHRKGFVPLTGRWFGNIEVVSEVGMHRYTTKNNKTVTETIYLCKCHKCLQYKYMRSISLTQRTTLKSCGCMSYARDLQNDIIRKKNQKTSKNATILEQRMYELYRGMHASAKTHQINVCSEWTNYQENYENFKKWLSENNWIPDETQISRIDKRKGFSPENCKIVKIMIRNDSSKEDKRLWELYNTMFDAKINPVNISDEWNNYPESFIQFKEWALRLNFDVNRSRLVRLDRNGDFSPNNCRINNDFILYNNRYYIQCQDYIYNFEEISKIVGITKASVSRRFSEFCWTAYDVLTTPNQNKHKGVQHTLEEIITPMWKDRNHYDEFKKLGIID